MRTSETIGELSKALAAVQGVLRGAKEDSKNPHLRVKYASLTACWTACRAPLSANGLAVMQGLECADGVLTCTTRLAHSSGEWVESAIRLPVESAKGLSIVQSVGSVATYARRYGLCALVGVAPYGDDDDAQERPRSAGELRKIAGDGRWPIERDRFLKALADLGCTIEEVVAAELAADKLHPNAAGTEGRRAIIAAIREAQS